MGDNGEVNNLIIVDSLIYNIDEQLGDSKKRRYMKSYR